MLFLDEYNRATIALEAEAGYPDEICGFLIGRWDAEVKTVTRLLFINNNWEESGNTEFADAGADFSEASRRRRFKIPPEEYYQADKAARIDGETILGFYHSHPDHPARPSEYDLRLAQEIFPGFSYIIVSVRGGKAAEMTSSVLRDDYSQFDPEEIIAVPVASTKEN
jgi:proteasome lid subunit RPN8/RPN11